MSWDQDYIVPSIDDLLEQLTGKRTYQLLEQELNRQGIKIVHVEEVLLDDGFMQDVIGYKVELSDGRVFVPKLVERFSENGNHGIDSYQYFTEDETPNVSHTGLDHAAEGADETVVAGFETTEDDDGCGCGD